MTIDELFGENIYQIEKDINNSKYPQTAKSLFRFYKKISSIKILIDKVTDSDEIYSAKILLRALFEHIIVAYYIFHRSQLENDDKVGEDYYLRYFIHEFYKQAGYTQKIDNIRNNKTNNISGYDYVRNKHKELTEVTKQQYQKANQVGNQFKVDKILKQLNIKKDKNPDVNKLHDFMLGFLDEYNKLSSYVHGGPFSEKQTFDESIDLLKEKKYVKDWAESGVSAIKEEILIFLIDDNPMYIKLLKLIMDEREK